MSSWCDPGIQQRPSDPRVKKHSRIHESKWLPNPAERISTNIIEHHRTWWATAQAQMSFIYILYIYIYMYILYIYIYIIHIYYTYIYVWVEYQPLSIKNNKEMKATRLYYPILSYTDTSFLDNWNLDFLLIKTINWTPSHGSRDRSRWPRCFVRSTRSFSEAAGPGKPSTQWSGHGNHTTVVTHKKWWFGAYHWVYLMNFQQKDVCSIV